MHFVDVVILSLIEGLTEFLPISSTGHLIIATAALNLRDEGFIKSFNVIIQSGAILSVLVLYWRRFLPNLEFYKKLFLAFLPAAVIGMAIKSKIDLILGSVEVVAVALLIGGIILIWSDHRFQDHQQQRKIESLNLRQCLLLGLIQCFAFVPGVSRSGATIVGGLFLGLSRKEAAEFSFFLAVPTLLGATAVKLQGILRTVEPTQWTLLILGIVLSFFFALIAIRFFIHLVSRYGFRFFGIYRIVLSIVILSLIYSGVLSAAI